ncbi:MAG: helix-turn-helix transcriptional regulator [Ardenticatenaceae bacterium]|nr:helix-turn-helix transcriptional regulator [Anaerolineales bacterium]MCB8940786.1 helix-turn-helix transcriptional regulator [Ardenticatenaceae bacterium]MCB8972125.1 helix-turn-helix transcriptional regulator [Ardenticatenaceae bacterium]
MNNQLTLPQEFLVDDLEALKVIAHNTRLDILQSLKRPKTVKEIAKLLKLPATKLYYHVNLMEKHGLIQVVETNIVSGILEKKYQVVAQHYRIDNRLLTEQTAASEELEQMLNTIFDITRTEIRRTVQHTKQNPFAEDNSIGILWRASFRLTPAQHKEFHGRIQSLLQEMTQYSQDDVAENDTLYGLTLAYYPIHTPDEADA